MTLRKYFLVLQSSQCVNVRKSTLEKKMPCHRVQEEVFILIRGQDHKREKGKGETSLWRHKQQKRGHRKVEERGERGRQSKKEKEDHIER